jgi:hypothetical protein
MRSGSAAPATQRVWEWMPLLGFDYDSSYHDTAPYEPTPGGCCSYLPTSNGDIVELPITLPEAAIRSASYAWPAE